MDGKQIKDASITKAKLALVDPVNNLDPATKQWVLAMLDAALWAQDWKNNVRLASTANVDIASAPANLDSVAMAAGNRILLKDQATGSQNGVRIFTAIGAPLLRATDFDSSNDVTSGAAVYVTEGTVNAKHCFKIVTVDPIVLDTTAIVFEDLVPTVTAPTPSLSNKNVVAVATVNDGDVACNTAIAGTPANDSYVEVSINGEIIETGNGNKLKAAYFSSDAGVTAKTWANIATGDKLYWNGSVAGYQLAVTDLVSFYYNV